LEQRTTNIISHMSRSYHELAKIIHAERQVTVHMSQLIGMIPDRPTFQETGMIIDNAGSVTDSITAYLNGLADLEEAVAENLSYIVDALAEKVEE
jgi:hypothetical protein